MSYIDKCCGVCDEYQELTLTGKQKYWKFDNSFTEEYKRFHTNSHNVCTSCVEGKILLGINVESLSVHKKLTSPKNITKGYTLFLDPTNNRVWKCKHTRMSKEELLEGGITPKFTKPKPEYYEVTGDNINHRGLFSYGGVFCYDKRKLRRVLRNLGVSGKVEKLIK